MLKKTLRRSCVFLAAFAGLSFVATVPLFDLRPAGETRPAGRSVDARVHPASDVCSMIVREAERWSLPHSFFMRLIWQESRFDRFAVSPAGAQGIAQFMPATARERGLADPYAPSQALAASASLLADLRSDFGNLGLAAAAYNAGPGAVRAWLKGKRGLPEETRNYVLAITGTPAVDWAEAEDEYSVTSPDPRQDCLKLASGGKPRRGAALQNAVERAARDEPRKRAAIAKRAKSHVRTAGSEPFCAKLAATGAVCRSVPR